MDRFCDLSPTLRISRVLTGLWQIADIERQRAERGECPVQLDAEETAKCMRPYVDAGFTTFDMADHYGSAEVIAGAFRSSIITADDSGDKEDKSTSIEKVKFLTKWVPKPGQVKNKQDVIDAIILAKTRLQTSKIDLLQYHAWNFTDPIWLDILFWLQELKDEGHIGELGVTNFDAAHLRIACASGIELVSNQISYSLLDHQRAGASSEMVQVCEQYNIKILAFGVLAGGLLSEKWINQIEQHVNEFQTWSQMKYRRYIDCIGGWDNYQDLLRKLHNIAQSKNVSIANIVCRYILDQPHVGGIILGARLGQSEHIQDNMRIYDCKLSNEEIAQIQHHLDYEMNAIQGQCGDEYRKPPFLTASGDLSHHVEEAMRPPYIAKEIMHEYIQPKRSKKQIILTGTIWEDIAGYSRAVRVGNQIFISGTTATATLLSGVNKVIGGNDIKAQTYFILDKIEGAILSLGGTLDDLVRTRIYLRNVNQWEPVARAHGERFINIQPANTLVEAKLVGDHYLVEIEADAICCEEII